MPLPSRIPDLDAFLVSSPGNSVLINDGAGSFTAVDVAGAAGSVALGDLDGDGDLDVIVAIRGRANQIRINDGTGTFTAADVAGGVRDSGDVALGDLDGDRDLDALVVNFGQADQILINDGTGDFTAADVPGGTGSSSDVALGDLDGDGDLDAFVATGFGTADRFLINEGNGDFTATDTPDSTTGYNEVALGDLDGDGDLDVFLATYLDTNDKILINDGTGSFTARDTGIFTYRSQDVALGDLDGDGDLDAFVANSAGAYTSDNDILFNNGDATFTRGSTPSAFQSPPYGGFSNAVALGDLDGDGDLDIYVANNGIDEILTNNGDGTFTAAFVGGGSRGGFDVALGDLDSDGGISPVNEAGLPKLGTDDLLPVPAVIGQTIRGGSGDDRLIGGSGSDDIFGRGGSDNIRGKNGHDDIRGGSGNDTIRGGSGNDHIRGESGNDFIRGDGGNDDIYGGSGNDLIRGDGGNDDIYGGSGNDLLRGDGGNDDIYGNAGDDRITGGSGNDHIRGGNGNDDIYGGGGKDDIRGDGGRDILRGASGNDTIRGGSGNDHIRGDSGNDFIRGDGGSDDIWGNRGDDDIDGGRGNDYMRGGAGADAFILQPGNGHDKIGDFVIGEDVLSLEGELQIHRARVADTNSDGTDDTVLVFDSGGSLTLLGVTPPTVLRMVEPDLFPGIDLTGAFDGVALSVEGRPELTVLSEEGLLQAGPAAGQNIATTGSNVFAHELEPGRPQDEALAWTSPNLLLRADFDNPTNFVSIDVIADDDDTFQLQAFDVSGSVLETVVSGDLRNESETLEISRPTADISYILVGGIFPEGVGFLDNLRFNAGLDVLTADRPFPAVFELSTLASGHGRDGFVLNGINADDGSGQSVSAAGDVNNDGIDDLIIGAPFADPNGSSSGQSYVVFGSDQDFRATFELSLLLSANGGDGSAGFVINSIDEFDGSGQSVSAAGDVNNDGIDDLIIGASGESYVVFGSNQGFLAEFELSSLLPTNGGDGGAGFVFRGDISGDSVSAAGDVNNDGIDDLIIGAPFADPNGRSSGQSYVVFGSDQGFRATFELSSLLLANGGDGSAGFVINGIDEGDLSGISASAAGDVNNDGIEDLIIGALFAEPGESYVVFGNDQGFPAEFELSSLLSVNGGDGSAGFVINGINASGRSVSAAGDVNDDGIDDLVIGASGADPNGFNSGQSSVVFGSDQGFTAQFDLDALLPGNGGDGSAGLVINGIKGGDASGHSVSAVGDVDGDGIDDLIIGAFSAGPNGARSGQSYVIFGRSQGFPAVLELSSFLPANGGDGSAGIVINGIRAADISGWSVSAAGDVDDDGIDDLIIGARGADPNGFNSGQSYVVFGVDTLALDDIALLLDTGSADAIM